jgi:hypothetical protein
MPTTGENNKGAGVGTSLPKKAATESGSSNAPAHAVAAVAADTNPTDATITTVKIDPITALQDDIGMYVRYPIHIHANPHSYLLNTYSFSLSHLNILLFRLSDCHSYVYIFKLTPSYVSDGLSLAMFEGLRGLRDAVAPESGNLAGEGNPTATADATDENNNTTKNVNGNGSNTAAPDMDELWLSYQRGDPATVKLMQSIVSSTATNTASTPSAASRALLPTNAEDFARLYNTKMEVEKDTQLVMKLAGTVLEKSRQIDKRVDDYLTPNRTRTREQQMARIQELLIQNQQVTVELEQAHVTAKARRDVCRRFIRDNTCAALGIEQIND